jgi:hypothetical protein
MKELILYNSEIEVLKDLKNNLDKYEILSDLEDYGFIKWVCSDDRWYLDAWLNVNWKQVLRQLENRKITDNFEFELDLGIIKIRTK